MRFVLQVTHYVDFLLSVSGGHANGIGFPRAIANTRHDSGSARASRGQRMATERNQGIQHHNNFKRDSVCDVVTKHLIRRARSTKIFYFANDPTYCCVVANSISYTLLYSQLLSRTVEW